MCGYSFFKSFNTFKNFLFLKLYTSLGIFLVFGLIWLSPKLYVASYILVLDRSSSCLFIKKERKKKVVLACLTMKKNKETKR